MIIGTAGFTAMASVLALEDRGLAGRSRVLVTGATGGVGSQSVTYLSVRGYRAVASTGSEGARAWLLERGAIASSDATTSATAPTGTGERTLGRRDRLRGRPHLA